MPSKHATKIYVEGSYYHIFNRGVEQRKIFQDEHDYKTFLYNIRRYLEPGFKVKRIDPKTGEELHIIPKQMIDDISLLGFCLMPNHFHLLVKLQKKQGMSDLVKRICNNYTAYFNRKYERIGKLYQGVYKAVLVKSQEQFLQLSRYIHLNPTEIIKNKATLEEYPFSSFYYISKNLKPPWLKWEDMLMGQKREGYVDFVKSKITQELSENELELIKPLIIG